MYSVDNDIENIPFFEKELLTDHCEEDIALIATPCVNLSDEEDIDDGEFWEDEEDSDIDNDTECSHYHSVIVPVSVANLQLLLQIMRRNNVKKH